MLMVYRLGPGPRDATSEILYPVIVRADASVVGWVSAASDGEALVRAKELAQGRELTVEPALAAAGAELGLGAFALDHLALCYRAHLCVSAFGGGSLDGVEDARRLHDFFDAAAQLGPLLSRVQLWRALVDVVDDLEGRTVERRLGVLLVGEPDPLVAVVSPETLGTFDHELPSVERIEAMEGLLVGFRREPEVVRTALEAAYRLSWVPSPTASVEGRRLRLDPSTLRVVTAVLEGAAANVSNRATKLRLTPLGGGAISVSVGDIVVLANDRRLYRGGMS